MRDYNDIARVKQMERLFQWAWLCRDGKLFSHYYSSTVLFEQKINLKFRLIYKFRSIKTKISLLIIGLGTISSRSAPIKKSLHISFS